MVKFLNVINIVKVGEIVFSEIYFIFMFDINFILDEWFYKILNFVSFKNIKMWDRNFF